MDTDNDVFEHYNPFTDTNLFPTDPEKIYNTPSVPSPFFDTVRRAKQLIKGQSIEELKSAIPTLKKYTELGLYCMIKNPDNLYRDINSQPADDPDTLASYLDHGEHCESFESSAVLFGILAAAHIGMVHAAIWPSEKQIADREKLQVLLKSLNINPVSPDPNHFEYMFNAVKAVAFGEQYVIRSNYSKDKSISEKNKANAQKKNKVKTQIIDKYLTWCASLPVDHSYRFESQAIHDFLSELNETEKQFLTKGFIDRTLPKKLKEYCKQHQAAHPFKK